MRDSDRRSLVRLRLRALLVASSALVGLAACGARSSTIDDSNEPTDCAVERQRVFDDCEKKCGVAKSPMRRAGRTSGRAPHDVGATDEAPMPCIEECITGVQRSCEATATCRCSDSLLTVSGR